MLIFTGSRYTIRVRGPLSFCMIRFISLASLLIDRSSSAWIRNIWWLAWTTYPALPLWINHAHFITEWNIFCRSSTDSPADSSGFIQNLPAIWPHRTCPLNSYRRLLLNWRSITKILMIFHCSCEPRVRLEYRKKNVWPPSPKQTFPLAAKARHIFSSVYERADVYANNLQ